MADNSDFHPPITEEKDSLSTVIPVPIPVTLYCSKCADQPRSSKHKARGSFAGKKPHLTFLEHLRGVHFPVVTARFRCRVCSDTFALLRHANLHVRNAHASQQVSQLAADPSTEQASSPPQALASPPEPSAAQPPVSSPLLELTAAHLLGSIAEDLEVGDLPLAPVFVPPVSSEVVSAPPNTWPAPLVPLDPPAALSHQTDLFQSRASPPPDSSPACFLGFSRPL